MEEFDPEKKSEISNGAVKNLKEGETQQLSKKERRLLKRQHKQEEQRHSQRAKKLKKILWTGLGVLIVGGGILSLGWFATTRSHLPPTTMVNHSEAIPPAHILTRLMPEVIQKHMLEHADGKGKPGIVIQYNCDKFECEPDLIEKLVALVEQYPDNVYLAPNNYDGKIILTKLNKREILDNFDEDKIRSFIER